MACLPHRGAKDLVECATLVELVLRRASASAEKTAFRFLGDGEVEAASLTYAELVAAARTIAATLQDRGLVGKNAILLYAPGLEFVKAMLACFLAGVVAVPTAPPDSARPARSTDRLQAIADDAGADAVLTTTDFLPHARSIGAQQSLASLPWLPTDGMSIAVAADWRDPEATPRSIAYLQYTSGSTSRPRGVVITHDNVLSNVRMIVEAFGDSAETVVVSWLPHYHDLGLVGAILYSLCLGATAVLMPAAAFLQRPARWLRAIMTYGGTYSPAPNFAYDLCVRKISIAERAALDLRTWSHALNGGEPVHTETLDAFASAFRPSSFDPKAFYPAYGLAEATVFVSGGKLAAAPAVRHLKRASLEQGALADADGSTESQRATAGIGQIASTETVLIVDPVTRARCTADRIGEIWVAGPHVAAGYRNLPDETEQTFRAHLDTGEGPFLRTGDIGFLRDDGQLFLTSRLKDLIIIRGRNHYPQDIERTAERSHSRVRGGSVAAFAMDREGGESLVIVAEVDIADVATNASGDVAVTDAVRRAVADEHELHCHAVVLLARGSLPKTTSGKVQRGACLAAFLGGALRVVYESVHEGMSDDVRTVSRAPAGRLGSDLRSVAPHERADLIEAHLREEIAWLLRLRPSQLPMDAPLGNLGLDSLVAVTLWEGLERQLGIVLTVGKPFSDSTLPELGRRLARDFDDAQ